MLNGLVDLNVGKMYEINLQSINQYTHYSYFILL